MAALATPLSSDGGLDYPGLVRLSARIQSAPVSGICPVGSTGEGPLLSRSIRLDVTKTISENVPIGVAVIPAAAGMTVRDVVEDVTSYAKAGASAVLVPPPFYYPLDQRSVLAFYRSVALDSPLPVVIYNIPQMTKVPVSPEVVAELAMLDRIVGIKDSSRDFEYFSSVCAAVQRSGASNFSPLTGTDTMLMASMLIGGKGTIAASANLVPELVCDLYNATLKSEFADALVLQQQLMDVVFAVRKHGFPYGWKLALSLVGVCEPHPASPVVPPGGDESAGALKVELERLGLMG